MLVGRLQISVNLVGIAYEAIFTVMYHLDGLCAPARHIILLQHPRACQPHLVASNIIAGSANIFLNNHAFEEEMRDGI